MRMTVIYVYMRYGFVENQYCVLMQYWFSETVTDPLYVQFLPGTSAALHITYTLYSINI